MTARALAPCRWVSTDADIAEGRSILLNRNETRQAYENNVRKRLPQGIMIPEGRWSSDVY